MNETGQNEDGILVRAKIPIVDLTQLVDMVDDATLESVFRCLP